MLDPINTLSSEFTATTETRQIITVWYKSGIVGSMSYFSGKKEVELKTFFIGQQRFHKQLEICQECDHECR
jgi:hypothetical protein